MMEGKMRIGDILSKDCIKIPLEGAGKEAIISELVGLMAKAGIAENAGELSASAMEREGLMSTGIGKGVAIPHGRTRGVKRMAGCFGLARSPVDFGSLDGLPVQIFFFLATPQNIVADHVKALALVSRLLNREEVRARLLAAKTADDVLKVFAEAEGGEQR